MDAEDFELAVTAVILQRRVRKRRFKRKQKTMGLKRQKRKNTDLPDYF